jgi:hypothetical protein
MSQMEVKRNMFSMCSRTVQLHDSLGSRRVYKCSEASFSSHNGDRACGAYY